MTELFRKVVPYEFNYLCDACGNGMVRASGEKDGDGFIHSCMICSKKVTLPKSYPHIEHFGEGEEPEHKE